MTPDFVVSLGRDTMQLTLLLAAPLLGAGLLVGLVIAILQSVTQIQEITLTFIPKIIAVMIALVIFLPWMLSLLTSFTVNLITNIPLYIR